MYEAQSTPSVDFHFQDATVSHPSTCAVFEESEVKYELSCTHDKKIYPFEENSARPLLNINQQYPQINTSAVDDINSEEFFQDFQSRFVVTFEQSCRQETKLSSQQLQDKENFSLLPNKATSIFQPIQLSVPDNITKYFFGRTQCKAHQLKSDIISVKKKVTCHPVLAIKKKKQNQKFPRLDEAQSDKITKKKPYSKMLSKLDFPQTCRHFDGELFFSENTNMGSTDMFRKVYKRLKKKRSPSLRVSSLLQKSLQSTSEELSVKGNNKPFSKIKHQKKELDKSNIFVRLPGLR